MARKFSGEYASGQLTEWGRCLSSGEYNQSTGEYFLTTDEWKFEDHTLGIGPVGGSGYAVRQELRDGDTFQAGGDADALANTQKAQFTDHTDKIYAGDVRWHAWSTMFEQFDAYPVGYDPYGFLLTHSWHTSQDGAAGGATVIWGAPKVEGQYPGSLTFISPNGSNDWMLYVDKYEADRTNWNRVVLLERPVVLGEWIDVKMEIGWDLAADGYVRCWINNELQTLKTGGTVWNGATTVINPNPGEYYFVEHTVYRSDDSSWNDMIIHNSNYRSADSESDL